MKTVKQWARDGHTVIIQAEFIKKGFNPYWIHSEDDIKDVVKLEARIYNSLNPDDLKQLENFETDAYEGRYKEVIEERRFRRDVTRDLTLPEVYEESLEKLTKWCNDDIDDRNYNKKITDGLPDSLLYLV